VKDLPQSFQTPNRFINLGRWNWGLSRFCASFGKEEARRKRDVCLLIEIYGILMRRLCPIFPLNGQIQDPLFREISKRFTIASRFHDPNVVGTQRIQFTGAHKRIMDTKAPVLSSTV
jgi:hypothetical protein